VAVAEGGTKLMLCAGSKRPVASPHSAPGGGAGGAGGGPAPLRLKLPPAPQTGASEEKKPRPTGGAA